MYKQNDMKITMKLEEPVEQLGQIEGEDLGFCATIGKGKNFIEIYGETQEECQRMVDIVLKAFENEKTENNE